MKILLLSVNSQTFFYSQVVIPFGLASLGSYVQKKGYQIRGIEMNTPPEKISQRYLKADKQLLSQIRNYRPDLVAMSTYAENIHNVLFWSEVIKKSLPETTIVLGGNHASYIDGEILERCPAVDFVVRFEGEIPFKKLCDQIDKSSQNFDDIPSITYRQNGKIRANNLIGLIKNLDTLPPLNYDFFESQSFSNLTHADMITARGCPFHCTFCNCNHYWQKRYRTLSIPRVIGELKALKNKYPNLKTVRFRDESISINKKRCLQLCRALTREQLGLKFSSHSRLDGLDEEVVKHLAKAGFEQLYIGLESGSQAVLDRLQKGIKIKKVYQLVPLLRKYHLGFRFSLMLATPGETMKEALKTIQLVNDLDLSFDEFYFGFGITIYPGTTDCQRFLKKYPRYRWLSRQKLGGGYEQTLDGQGNVVSLRHLGARYSLSSVYEKINQKLQKKLRRFGETDYFDFRASEEAAKSPKNTCLPAIATLKRWQAGEVFRRTSWTPRRWRETIKPFLAKQTLRFLFKLENCLYALEGRLSIVYGGGLHTKHKHIKYHQFFINNLNPGERVLDIGCGHGFVAYQMVIQVPGLKVTGFDLSKSNIEFGRKYYQHPNLKFIHGDALKKLPEGKFDVVVLSNVLEHFSQRVKFLKKIMREIKPKRLFIRVPCFERDWRVPLKKELGIDYRLDPGHFIEYTRESYLQEIKRVGLKVVKIEHHWGETWSVVKPLRHFGSGRMPSPGVERKASG